MPSAELGTHEAEIRALEEGARELGIDLDSEQIASFREYAGAIRAGNRRAGLTSQAALDDLVNVHFLDSLALVPLLRRLRPDATRLFDVGSGGGFPGLVVKLAMPSLDVTLIEATKKKADFLTQVATELEIEVSVLARRAEDLGKNLEWRERADICTARAIGALPIVLELTLPFVAVGGVLIAQRGREAASDAASAEAAASMLGGRIVEIVPHPIEGIGTAAVVVEKTGPTPSRFPRRPGIPAKRPLGVAESDG